MFYPINVVVKYGYEPTIAPHINKHSYICKTDSD